MLSLSLFMHTVILSLSFIVYTSLSVRYLSLSVFVGLQQNLIVSFTVYHPLFLSISLCAALLFFTFSLTLYINVQLFLIMFISIFLSGSQAVSFILSIYRYLVILFSFYICLSAADSISVLITLSVALS